MAAFSDDRAKHCLEVARLMYDIAKELGWDEKLCQEMFMLGYLHDIGYDFTSDSKEHMDEGSEITKRNCYIYWREIKYHGLYEPDFSSDYLDLLNFADLSVNGKGERCGIDQRMVDISERHGVNSVIYKNTLLLAEQLRGRFPFPASGL